MSRRYYESLSDKGKALYDDIVSRIKSYQTEWTFSQIPFEAVSKIYGYVLKDHPEFFWLSPDCEGTKRSVGDRFTQTLKPKTLAYIGSVPEMRRQFESVADKLVASARLLGGDLYGQILFLHDMIVENTDYAPNAEHRYDAYGCLVKGKAVCSGYAAAFQVLMEKLGVECGRVTGRSCSEKTGDVSHIWNYIRLDDGYYFIDVTWDDPITSGGTKDNLSHDYFCLDLDEIRLTHTLDEDQFVPRGFGKKYNFYVRRGWYTERYSFGAVCRIAVSQLRTSDRFSVKFGSKSELAAAKRELLDGQKVFSIPGMTKSVSFSESRSGLILCFGKKR